MPKPSAARAPHSWAPRTRSLAERATTAHDLKSNEVASPIAAADIKRVTRSAGAVSSIARRSRRSKRFAWKSRAVASRAAAFSKTSSTRTPASRHCSSSRTGSPRRSRSPSARAGASSPICSAPAIPTSGRSQPPSATNSSRSNAASSRPPAGSPRLSAASPEPGRDRRGGRAARAARRTMSSASARRALSCAAGARRGRGPIRRAADLLPDASSAIVEYVVTETATHIFVATRMIRRSSAGPLGLHGAGVEKTHRTR